MIDQKLPMNTFPHFAAYPELIHGFSTRAGGVSEGIYASLNLDFSRGDESEKVKENIGRFCCALGVLPENTVFSKQEHGTVIRRVTEADRGKGLIFERDYTCIDGLITNCPDIALMTFYADCVPLFFFDPQKKVIALSHAGWRGTVAGIAAVTVGTFVSEYGSNPSDLLVGIGPSIGPCCYEVGPDVWLEAQKIEGLPLDLCILPNKENDPQKRRVDLWQINREILKANGVSEQNIIASGLCTCCHPESFFSHRASNGKRGAMAALMQLK